jgi:hypothetical protein
MFFAIQPSALFVEGLLSPKINILFTFLLEIINISCLDKNGVITRHATGGLGYQEVILGEPSSLKKKKLSFLYLIQCKGTMQQPGYVIGKESGIGVNRLVPRRLFFAALQRKAITLSPK